MQETIYELTQAGYDELVKELETRKTDISQEIAERLKEARALGDLSENSEYDDAKEEQGVNERRINEIENIIKYAKIISEDTRDDGKIGLGTVVTVKDEDNGDVYELKMVTGHESDFLRNKLSVESPLGSEIMGKEKGDRVTVNAPAGRIDYVILDICKAGVK